MIKTSIEFCDFSWNPITGCRNGCDYCWARKFNDRYFKTDFNIPRFYPERLKDKIPEIPKQRNYIAAAISPDKPVIFTVDMGDIFSKGIESIWQYKVFGYIESHPEANFLLLSKVPKLFLYWTYLPKNTFIGTSLDFAHNSKRIIFIKQMGMLGYRTFVNIEPLMSRMDEVDFSGIDFVIVGALTGRKYRPDPTWHKSIRHPLIYYKKNYQVYFPELKNNNQ
jgi:protein gp37